MLAPLIIDPLIAALLFLLAAWISDMVGQRLRHVTEQPMGQVPVDDSTILDFRAGGQVHGCAEPFPRWRRRVRRSTSDRSALKTRAETWKMLAPLGFFLAIIVIICTLILLTCWFCDNDKAVIVLGSMSHRRIPCPTSSAETF